MTLSYTKLAGLNQVIKIISGPGILFLLGNSLGDQELAVLMVFISISASTQLFDGGLAFVMKHCIAHETTNNFISQRMKNYYIFSKISYAFISIASVVVLGLIGGALFEKSIQIDWQGAWICLIFGIFCTLWISPKLILAEGRQMQSKFYFAKLMSTITYILAFAIGIYVEESLLSIGLALVISASTQYILLRNVDIDIKNQNKILILNYRNIIIAFKSVYKEIYKFLYKIMLTWILGYFFWNSWNLIVFKKLDYIDAAKLAFSFTLLRACFSFSDSLIQSQTYRISHFIADNKKELAKGLLKRITLNACMLYILICFMIIISKIMFPEILAFQKIISGENLIYICIFYLILLVITAQATYCRSYKEEPYFNHSLYTNIGVPLVFYFLIGQNVTSALIGVNFIILGSLVWSTIIFIRYFR